MYLYLCVSTGEQYEYTYQPTQHQEIVCAGHTTYSSIISIYYLCRHTCGLWRYEMLQREPRHIGLRVSADRFAGEIP
ncbi:hypothetical protein J3E69DRAFT_338891 [Trichoderma sp. SZMC 28015]